jgi:hypothetical protein
MKKRYSISEDDCKVCIADFYNNAAKIAGYHVTNKTSYDCRKICVSKSVEKLIREYYEENGTSKELIGIYWVLVGPKASIDSDDFVFEIEDGFVVAEVSKWQE